MHWSKSTLLQPLTSQARVGLITDVDGTISPIVSQPDQAYVTANNKQLLQKLQTTLVLVAAVSGRSAADIYERVGIADMVYIGNHGLERWADGQVQVMPEVAQYRAALEAVMDEFQPADGMQVEDKGATLSIHYRNTENPTWIAEQFQPVLQVLAQKHGLRLFQGRMVFEVRPPVEANKGTALAYLIQTYQLDAAVFLGDDTTDVDAMQVARQYRERGACYSIAVGVVSDDAPPSVRENADVLADGVQDVEAFLAWLLEARTASST